MSIISLFFYFKIYLLNNSLSPDDPDLQIITIKA